MAPAKSIPMNAIMIYMSGTSLQIFTVVITAMLFLNPIKAMMTTQQSKTRIIVSKNSNTNHIFFYKIQHSVDLNQQEQLKINQELICYNQSQPLLVFILLQSFQVFTRSMQWDYYQIQLLIGYHSLNQRKSLNLQHKNNIIFIYSKVHN